MTTIKQAVILAGGFGTRMRPLTNTIPKPMIPIHGRPFLAYLIELLKSNGIEEIIILVGYLHEEIEKYFQDGRKFGVNIKYSFSPAEDDTGTRLRKAKDLLNDEFLLLYGDNYWPLQFADLLSYYKNKKRLGLVTVYRNRDNYSKNNILVNNDGIVEDYDKTRKHENLNGIDIGFFILKKDVINLLPEVNCLFETTVLPKLIAKKQLAGFLTDHKYYSLSNLERIPTLEEYFKKKKVVFLDRDGTINHKATKALYISKWGEFHFLPKVKEALKLLNEKGYTVFIVTNQPGIARKMMTEKNLEDIHKRMKNEVNKHGGEIFDIFVCKHGWYDGCFCRKPNPGLFFEAARKYHLNLYDTYCVGDDERDMIAATHAGCKTFLINEDQNLYDIVKKYL